MVLPNVNNESGVQLFHRFIRGEAPNPPDYYAFGSITDPDDINDQLGSIPNDALSM